MKSLINKHLLLVGTLSLSCVSAAYSQSFGKLFTSPEEREYLDYLRQEFLTSTAGSGFDIDDNLVPEIPDDADYVDEERQSVEFYLGGFMTRVDGGRTVWLNGIATPESELPSNASIVVADGITALKLVTEDASYILKPGQTVDVTTGELWEGFNRSPSATDQTPSPETAEEPISPDVQTSSLSGAVEVVTESSSATGNGLDFSGGDFTPEQLQAIEVLRAMGIYNLE